MEKLEDLRQQLDKIDKELVKLYRQRMAVCNQVGDYKLEAGKAVFDRERENEKLQEVATFVDCAFDKKAVRDVFLHLMSLSRKLQYQKLSAVGSTGRLPFIPIDSLDLESARVVFQGVEGSYGQEAMQCYFGKNCNSYSVRTFQNAFTAIDEGGADYAVLPIENSSMGSVREIYDLLVEFENYIVGEIVIPISHTLAGLPGTRLTDIEQVYSKAEALMQTTKFLDAHPKWQQISVVNTAIAAQKIVQDNDSSKAAVCSAYAAKRYHLEILQDQINDEPDNSTRFIVITNQKVFLKKAAKISICFELENKSGSLYHLLSHFIYNDLNMTRIESRPIEGRAWEYRFFVDFEGNMADVGVKSAIRGLREEAKNLKILGNYETCIKTI
ncbi:MAG: prephenate dehydratase [Lachnospiraceae bacterium]|nr:prephenate dehydratase [Lachnospiraceae bacterium]